jgi:prophage DNA circulation protein
MDINQNLTDVLNNIARNRSAVEKNLEAADKAVSQLDDDSLAAINLLLNKFEHPQSVTQFVNAVAQKIGLRKAADEMDTAIAVLQTAVDDETFQAQAQAQLTANLAVATNPLPAAGQNSQSAPAA